MHAAAGLHPTDSPLFIPLTWGLARTDHANSTVYCCLRGRPFTVGVRLVADWITCIRFRAVLSTGELAAASTTSIFSVAHGTPKRHVRCFLCAKPALAQCPRYVAASLRVVHSVGVSTRAREGGQSAAPSLSAPPGGAFSQGEKWGCWGAPQPSRPIRDAIPIVVTCHEKYGGFVLPRCAWCPRPTLTAKSVLSAPSGDLGGEIEKTWWPCMGIRSQ